MIFFRRKIKPIHVVRQNRLRLVGVTFDKLSPAHLFENEKKRERKNHDSGKKKSFYPPCHERNEWKASKVGDS